MSRFRPVWPNADIARSAANRFRTKAIIRSNCGPYSANCRSKVHVCGAAPVVRETEPSRSAHWHECCQSVRRQSGCTWRRFSRPSSPYGASTKLLAELLPLEEQLNAMTIRNHLLGVAKRSEAELGAEQVSFVEGCPRDWAKMPIPKGPLTVGIDGGFVRAQRGEGWFEVIAGKSVLEFRRGDAGESKSTSASALSRPMMIDPSAVCSSF